MTKTFGFPRSSQSVSFIAKDMTYSSESLEAALARPVGGATP
ncbi:MULTISPECIES: hypothetical protein [Streptomyces]|nr:MULTISPECIES: hypothetical protein [unclassified Streptomyces]